MRASTIDYVILREDYMISKFKVLPKLVESDHCPIKFHILNSKLKESSSAEMKIHVMTPHQVPMFIYGKMKKDRIPSISTK